jgi:methylthioribose-1-phosphate isomerase
MHVETLRWEGGLDGCVRLIEQTLLPAELRVVEVQSSGEMFDAIRRLAVRGAPAIGVAAAYGLLLGVRALGAQDPQALIGRIREEAAHLREARPTAVNLSWALERMCARAQADQALGKSSRAILSGLLEEALSIHDEDRKTCRQIGEIGAQLLFDGARVLTHCNAGALATGGMGTALAPIYLAVEQKKRVAVFAGETRPLLQGARLTAWELAQAGIDVTLITDNMAGRVMYEGKVDLVIVGADRIALNGDVANKIGTYSLAVLAAEHGIPFYVAAPLSTFDPELDHGDRIPIEERAPEEVTEGFGRRTAPPGVGVYSPAFDVTPARLVRAIITDVGLIEPPSREKVEEALRRGGRI